MPKYSIGIQYTVWVDVESDNEADAIEAAVNTPYNYVDVSDTGAMMEIQEFSDPIVFEIEEA